MFSLLIYIKKGEIIEYENSKSKTGFFIKQDITGILLFLSKKMFKQNFTDLVEYRKDRISKIL